MWATAQRQRRDDSPERYLRQFDRIYLDPVETHDRVRSGRLVSIPTPGGVFEFALARHDIRAWWYKAEDSGSDGEPTPVKMPELNTYRGFIEGRPDVEIRFNIREDVVEGVILTPHDWYFVEPVKNYEPDAPATEALVYRASDIRPDAVGTCGTSLFERIGHAEDMVGPIPREADSGPVIADVATEADYEYVTAMGGSAGANSSILDVLNQVDGIYSAQLSVSLRVVYQHTWSDAGDPYSSTAPATMLGEFRSWYSSNMSAIDYDLAHMWTGKDMDGSTIGIAYLGVVCNARSYSYGVSQRFNSTPGKYILTAHEIGHNFGASHPDQASPVPANCSNTIMNSSVGTGTTFCQFSRDEISAHVQSYSSCLAAGSGGTGCDMSGDGQVNVVDLQRLVNVILGLTTCTGNCDINQDGRVDVLDLQRLANVVLGLATCP
jgi:hypothetical protein